MKKNFLFEMDTRLGWEGGRSMGSALGEVVYQMVYAHLLSPLSRKHQDSKKEEEKKKPHIKKPLNAFMLYMKEMRAKVVAECTLKESAAINQILGRRVGGPSLRREEPHEYTRSIVSGGPLHFVI